MKRIKLHVLAFMIVLLAIYANSASYNISRYRLYVNIMPESGEISVIGSVHLSEVNTDRIEFMIHETFIMDKLTVNGKQVKYTTSPAEFSFISPAKKRISADIQGIIDDAVDLEFEYHGKLKDIPEFGTNPDQKGALDDQINSRMVELAGYSVWYPSFESANRFDADLQLSLPVDWKAVCSGNLLSRENAESRSISKWKIRNDFDIVIVASPKLLSTTVESSDYNVEVYYTELPDKFINREANHLADSYHLFKKILGNPNRSDSLLKLIYSPKKKGQGKGGFARPGLIVASEGRMLNALAKDPDFSTLQWNAHEIAHSWWNIGIDQGDWINETFAEYFSVMAVEKFISKEKAEDIIESYRNYFRNVDADAPSIAKVPADNSGVNYLIRYFKGSLMMHEIRSLIGDDAFLQICHDFYQKFKEKRIGTEDFRSFWSDKLKNKSGILNLWLDSRGGLPYATHK